MIGLTPTIAVLLCTYNGDRYLRSQLESIERNKAPGCHLYVSDDGSRDDSLAILESFAEKSSGLPLSVRSGPGRGHAANFLSLLCADDIRGDYFALSDQDDIWDSDKLSRALAWLGQQPTDCPALYCARTRSISETGASMGLSPLFKRRPSFGNALIQNIAGGNTMVLNAAARELLRRTGPVDVVTHDWWIYQLVSGAGGRVHYDPEPCLSYRQHAANVIGANTGLRARAGRYSGFLGGRNRDWNERNLAALNHCRDLLTAESLATLDQFERMHAGGITSRLSSLLRGGVYAQTASGNLGLFFATMLKKI